MSVGKRLFGGSLVSPSAAKSVSPEKRVETIALEEVDEDVNAEGDRSLAEKQTTTQSCKSGKSHRLHISVPEWSCCSRRRSLTFRRRNGNM